MKMNGLGEMSFLSVGFTKSRYLPCWYLKACSKSWLDLQSNRVAGATDMYFRRIQVSQIWFLQRPLSPAFSHFATFKRYVKCDFLLKKPIGGQMATFWLYPHMVSPWCLRGISKFPPPKMIPVGLHRAHSHDLVLTYCLFKGPI